MCAYLLPVAINSFLYSILRPSSNITDLVFTSTATACVERASVMWEEGHTAFTKTSIFSMATH